MLRGARVVVVITLSVFSAKWYDNAFVGPALGFVAVLSAAYVVAHEWPTTYSTPARVTAFRVSALVCAGLVALLLAIVPDSHTEARVPITESRAPEKAPPDIIPFVPYSLKHGGGVGQYAQRWVLFGYCLPISFRDRSDHGGHRCVDTSNRPRFRGRIADPCYPARGINIGIAYNCYESPWQPSSYFDAFFTGPDKDVNPQPHGILQPSQVLRPILARTKGQLWGLELENGEHCIYSMPGRLEQDPRDPKQFWSESRPSGGTYLCATKPWRLNVVDADGWILGKIQKSETKGWRVRYQPYEGSPSWVGVVEGRSGPVTSE